MHKTCTVDSCDKAAITRGWCKAHYSRWIKTGSTSRDWSCKACGNALDHSSKRYCGPGCRPEQGNSRLCSVAGCYSRVSAREMCSTHYGRWRKTGNTDWLCRGCSTPLQSGLTKYCSPDCKPRCSVEGCDDAAYSSQGHCRSHDRQWRKIGEAKPFQYRWASKGGPCVVCARPVPEGSKRRKCCSNACQVRLSHHGGERAKVASCEGCGAEISLTERDSGGKLKRSDVKWCDDCIDQAARRRMYRYGVTPDQYQAASLAGCEICGRTDLQLHVDHDHDCCPNGYTCGQCVRGYLCGACNRAVGLLNEDADKALAAATYLLKTRDVLRYSATDLGGAPSRS